MEESKSINIYPTLMLKDLGNQRFFFRHLYVVGQSVIKNQPCDVIKMREMRGEVGKKTPKKRWIIPHFCDVTWLILETLCPTTIYIY